MSERICWSSTPTGGELSVEVTLVRQDQCDGGDFDFGNSYENGTLNRVIASLQAIRKKIPEEFRATARCQVDSISGYEGDHYPSITVSYSRPATDEENAQWHQQRALAAARKEAQERATLEALRAKYEAVG